MRNNPGYFESLLTNFPPDIPSFFENQIDMDLNRTFPSEIYYKDHEVIKSMKRILLAFSRRNTSIGYCQGFNFIVGRLIKAFQFEINKEEKVFWIFCQLIESILPINFYSEMAGIMVYQKIFEKFMHFYHKDIFKIFEKTGLSLESITTQWFVSIFAQNLKEDITKTIWDILFIDGIIVIFKAALGIFNVLKSQIIKLTTLEEVFLFFESNTKKIDDEDAFLFNIMLKTYDFDYEFINSARKKLEKDVITKLDESNIKTKELLEKSKIKITKAVDKVPCDLKWPVCKSEKEHLPKKVVNFLVYKSMENSFHIIDEYFSYGVNINKNVKQSSNEYKNLVIERRDHVCLKFKNENPFRNSKKDSNESPLKTFENNNLSDEEEDFYQKLRSTYREINFMSDNEIFKNLEVRASTIKKDNSFSDIE